MIFKNREEWRKWRHKGIGGSDAPIIWGESTFMTPYELWEQKILPEPPAEETNYILNRGNELEPIARAKTAAIYNMENGTEETFDAACVSMKEIPYMLSSLDGRSKFGTIICEFKFQSEPPKKGQEETEGQKKHKAVLRGEVPKAHWLQCQHNLLVSGSKYCIYGSFDGETLHTTNIYPDPEFMVKHLEKCADFWLMVQDKKPPDLTDRDFKTIRDKDLWNRFEKATADLAKARLEYEKVEEEVLERAEKMNHPRILLGDAKITKCAGKSGGIDYARLLCHPAILKAMQENKIDPETFRKKPGKSYWRIG